MHANAPRLSFSSGTLVLEGLGFAERLEMGAVEGHLQQVFGGQRHAAGPAGQLKAYAAHPLE